MRIRTNIFYIVILLCYFQFEGCKSNRYECHEYKTPWFYFEKFDSTSFDSIIIGRYRDFCGFDSLIQEEIFYYNVYNVMKIQDSVYFLSKQGFRVAGSEFLDPNYNWQIRFRDSVEIRIGDFSYEGVKCESNGYNECYCPLNSYLLEVKGCNYKVEGENIILTR